MAHKTYFTLIATALFVSVAILPLTSIRSAADSFDVYLQALESDSGPSKAEKPMVKPDPKRVVCAMEWDAYYKSEDIEIAVSTKGDDNEIVVFFCQLCSLEKNFVEPFLNTPYHGMTGMERIKKCGFKQVVFKGGAGINEVVRDVPE